MVLEKTLESLLNCKEIKPVKKKNNKKNPTRSRLIIFKLQVIKHEEHQTLMDRYINVKVIETPL